MATRGEGRANFLFRYDVKVSCFVHVERLFLIILPGSIFQARALTARLSLKGAGSESCLSNVPHWNSQAESES